jgi:HEAT repeat protein
MNPCPTCGKPVDPLRAPAAKVRDGKIVAYCSKECAEAAETKPVVAPAPAPAAAAKPAAEKPVAKAVPKTVKDLDSGPVIEIIRETEPRNSSDAIEVADTGHIDDYVAPDRSSRHTMRIVGLVLLLVLAGGVLAAYQMGYLDKYLGREPAPSPPPPVVAPAPHPIEPPPPPAVAPEAAVDKAKTTLQAILKSNSPRVRNVAAEALARTGDADAIAVLAAALPKEENDLAKLELAYALARSGDKRGTDALVAALGSNRRDPKLEAARRLALLGDKRAVPVLSEYLQVIQLRLGAAEQLARVADPTALEALERIRKDDKATAFDRARATIALGLAGKAEVSDDLRKLLDDASESAFAAMALAALHDPAARPVLEKQLAVSSLRVGAARALRRLDPNLDAVPLLPPLLDALASAKDTEQAQAAEAILLLAGPAAWSEHE